MKKLLFFLLFLPLMSFGQETNTSKELRYHFLDSTLSKEILIINPQKLSNKEKKSIYHYVEYYVLEDSIVGDISYFYAKGMLPFWQVSNTFVKGYRYKPSFPSVVAPKVKFSSVDERKGVLRSFGPIKNRTISKPYSLPKFILDGTWRRFHTNGILFFESPFKNGNINGTRDIYVAGTLRAKLNYKNDTLDGFASTYYRNGKIFTTREIDKGKIIGLYRIYNSKGKVNIINLNENSARQYLDDKSALDSYEGLYRYSSTNKQTSQYLFLIIKSGYKYNAHIVNASCVGCGSWRAGDTKFQMSEGSVPGVFDVTWMYPEGDNRRDDKFIFIGELEGGLLKGNNINLIKLHPKLNSNPNKRVKTGEWAGNGSGIIISKSGHIVTNHHVIEDADDIEVEFIIDGEIQKFNAEVVQVDKTNDLAIIKIFDMNFDGLDNLPYNFKTRSSDVGTKIYAYGYPMALTVMGKEIKITDGIISSKSGYDGDITTYQITAPIQAGNSGGPLFDDKANFIGINSSGLRKDVADNVGYTIKSSYVLNLIDVLPKTIDLPSSTKLQSLPLTEQIKEISKYVVLIKVK